MMATLPSLVVSAVTTFDGKALKKGEKQVSAFDKGLKNLGKSLLAAFSVKAIINFGEAAAKAFIADEKAASRLALSVKNLGLSFETTRIERYISELSAMSGITDDELRPSMQKLLQTTGSVTKSQELLRQAIDISRSSGVDYETVISDLSAAYVGNTKGLSKYYLGLTKAELKTMSFAEIQARLNDQFKGGNAAYLDTYAGKFELISTAAGEAQEIIGGALLQSITDLFGSGSVEKLTENIDKLAKKTAAWLDKTTYQWQQFMFITSDQAILSGFNPFSTYVEDGLKAIEIAYKVRTAARNAVTQGYLGSTPIGIYTSSADMAKQKKAQAEADKRAKELAAAQTKALAESKKKAALEKAAGVLDLARIGIAAALKTQISETDRLSLNLQLALLDKNDTAATKLAGELATAVKNNALLQAALLATPEAPNPYRNWKMPEFGTRVQPGADLVPLPPTDPNGQGPKKYVPQMPSDSVRDFGPSGGLRAGVIAGVTGQPSYTPDINIKVELDGVTVGGAIRDGSINDSLSGSFNTVNRGNFKGAVAT